MYFNLSDFVFRNGVGGSGIGGGEGIGIENRDGGYESNVRGRPRAGQDGVGPVHGNPYHGFRSTGQ